MTGRHKLVAGKKPGFGIVPCISETTPFLLVLLQINLNPFPLQVIMPSSVLEDRMWRTYVILFCMAALIFPIGFYINEVGGQPYKLPNNTVVGSSYVLFVLSIFFTIVGLLFAGKVCLPG